ncbi:MAG: tetratricopeptide repeat protein [Aliidongia sp.]
MTADQKNPLAEAMTLHQAGALDEAAQRYLRILQRAPRDFNALHFLGVLRLTQGKPSEAVRLIRQALAIDGRTPDPHVNLGNALAALGQLDQAVMSYRAALRLDPNLPQAHYNIGKALKSQGKLDEAVAAYRHALRLAPGYVEALYNLGNALKEGGRLDEALACYDRVLPLKPALAEAWLNRGNTLRLLHRIDEAAASYRQVLAIDPGSLEALNNLGNVLVALKQYEPALALLQRAAALAPHSVETQINLSSCLLASGHLAEAAQHCHAALTIHPDAVDAHYTLGLIQIGQDQPGDALASFNRALDLAPERQDVLSLAVATADRSCDWPAAAALTARLDRDLAQGDLAIEPFYFFIRHDQPRAQRLCAENYARNNDLTGRPAIWRGEAYRHDKIRIAYLSADLCNHATAYLTAELFERHDQTRFETTAISFGPRHGDEFGVRLENAFGRFIDVTGRSDRATALLLRELEIDLAVDLKGYTRDSRPGILAFRPAPLQLNFLGFPGTMGAAHIDYILADRFIIPEAHQDFYSEKVVYLPDSYQPNDSKRRIADHVPSRAEAGLPETGFVFCSFNNSYKITPTMFGLWMSLLHRVAGSVLWLLADNATAIDNLRRSAAQHGIAPDRLVFAPRIAAADHLARHRLADLMLDTLPCNAHTTASDALWAGLPLVTCAGTSFAGRVAGSLLMAARLPELIAGTLDDYAALALDLAQNPDRLAALKVRLARDRNSLPLFDSDRFRRHLEHAYETMWQRQQRGEPPSSFAVPPLTDT